MSPDERDEMLAAARELDPLAQELLGKSAFDCTWPELLEIGRYLDSEYAQAVHHADQARAELQNRDDRGAGVSDATPAPETPSC